MPNPYWCAQMPEGWDAERMKLEVPQVAANGADPSRVHHLFCQVRTESENCVAEGVHYCGSITAVLNYFAIHGLWL